jgi:hypothetical protein
MTSFLRHALAPLSAALLLAVGGAPVARADSASSAGLSGSGSASVGSASDSLGRSSAGSSRQGGHAQAEGDYRIVELTPVPDRPGMARLSLRSEADRAAAGTPPAAPDEVELVLPLQVVRQAALVAGQRVSARARPYGIEFAQGEPRQAFFLVLDDDRMRELAPRALSL